MMLRKNGKADQIGKRKSDEDAVLNAFSGRPPGAIRLVQWAIYGKLLGILRGWWRILALSLHCNMMREPFILAFRLKTTETLLSRLTPRVASAAPGVRKDLTWKRSKRSKISLR